MNWRQAVLEEGLAEGHGETLGCPKRRNVDDNGLMRYGGPVDGVVQGRSPGGGAPL